MSKSSEPERHEWQPHEFQAYKQTPYCGFSMSNIKAHRCGQPESAEVHAVEPRCVNHCGHHRSFIVNGVCNWKRTRGASEICGHVCEFATASEKVSQLPERPWPWAEFPEDSSTWQECVNQYVELKREIESLRAKADAPAFDFLAHLSRQREWSGRTFGPGARTAGVLDHIRKELTEIESDPSDLGEWIDVVILALDGAWRAGHLPHEILAALKAKQERNEGRTWPDWKTQPSDKAIEHDRSRDIKADTGLDRAMEIVKPYTIHLPNLNAAALREVIISACPYADPESTHPIGAMTGEWCKRCEPFVAAFDAAQGEGPHSHTINANAAADVCAERRIRDAAPPVSQWQPIESAPRDGTKVWLYRPNGEQSSGKWLADSDGGGNWWCGLARIAPTHWMPLPAPPAETAKGETE